MRSVVNITDFGASAKASVGCDKYVLDCVTIMDKPPRMSTETTPATPQGDKAKRRAIIKLRNTPSPKLSAKSIWIVPKQTSTSTQTAEAQRLTITATRL